MKNFNKSVLKLSDKELFDNSDKQNNIAKKNHSKNIEIINTYGKNFVNFFCEKVSEMPMFLDTSCPRALKRVAMVKDFIINSGEKIGVFYNPFINTGKIIKFSFSSLGTQTEELDNLSSYLKNYSSYKIVCTYIKLVQQSILNLSDGYGTTIDAVIAPSTFDPVTYGENPNNINVSFFNRMNTIDGRKGIKGMIVGTPDQPNNYPASSSKTMNETNIVMGQCYIPFGSTIQYLGPSGTNATLTYSDGETEDITGWKIILKPVIKVTTTTTQGAVFTSRIPNESMFYARISSPSANVSYRVYAEAIVEVIPNGNLLEEIPMFTPPINYSTVRIKQAFQQSFPSLIQGSYLEVYNQNNITDPYKFLKRLDEEEETKFFASDALNKPKRMRIISKSKENKIILTPDYVLKACSYLNTNIYENLSGTEYTKLMRGSIQKMAEIDFQFFPIISNDSVELSILTYKKLNEFKNDNKQEVLDLILFDEEGNEKSTRISIKTNGYYDLNKFKEKIAMIVKYLNANLFFSYPEYFEISIFSKDKFDGESFTLALIALLSGAPCGNVCTGNVKFEIKNEEIIYTIEKNDEEVLENKSKICTSDNPLITCGDYPAGMIALTSGVNVTPFENLNIITCKSIEEFVAYLFIPPKLRNYRYNYFVKYAGEIKSHLLNKNKDFFSLLAYMVLYASQEEIDNFLKNQKFSIDSNYYNKLKSSGFSTYIVLNKGKYYIDVNEVIESEPNLLTFINKNPIIINGRKYLPQGRLMSYLIENRLSENYKKKMTSDILEEIKNGIEMKSELTMDDVIESVKNFKNLYKEKANSNNIKIARREVLKDSNPFEKFKEEIDRIKKQIKKDIKDMNEYKNGRTKLISNNDVATIWNDLGGKNSFTKEDIKKIKSEDLIPVSTKIFETLINSNLMKQPKIKAALEKLDVPLKTKGKNTSITLSELETFITLFIQNMEQNEDDKEESRFIAEDEINKSEQIVKEEDIDKLF